MHIRIDRYLFLEQVYFTTLIRNLKKKTFETNSHVLMYITAALTMV